MSDEAPVKRWTGRRNLEVIIDISKARTTPVEVARKNDFTVSCQRRNRRAFLGVWRKSWTTLEVVHVFQRTASGRYRVGAAQ